MRLESFHHVPHVVKHPPQFFSGKEPLRVLNMQRYFHRTVDLHVHFRLIKGRSEGINEAARSVRRPHRTRGRRSR